MNIFCSIDIQFFPLYLWCKAPLTTDLLRWMYTLYNSMYMQQRQAPALMQSFALFNEFQENYTKIFYNEWIVHKFIWFLQFVLLCSTKRSAKSNMQIVRDHFCCTLMKHHLCGTTTTRLLYFSWKKSSRWKFINDRENKTPFDRNISTIQNLTSFLWSCQVHGSNNHFRCHTNGDTFIRVKVNRLMSKIDRLNFPVLTTRSNLKFYCFRCAKFSPNHSTRTILHMI